MAKPTHNDAMLMLQLVQWAASLKLSEAANWMWSDEFVEDYAGFTKKYPPGSEGSLNASKILGYYETLGTIYKHGLFNEDLLFDWLLVSKIWDRMKGYALGVRQESGSPTLYENFELMAKASADYNSRPAPARKSVKRK